ncbi:MAG: hypothetical protein ACYSWT_10430 [Planctomycetota bacterium]|jgi:hypothetical protein
MIDNRAPWYRPRNVLLALALVLIGLAFYAGTWALTAEPEPTVDYGKRMEALTARAQPPGENGWPYLVEAAGVMQVVEAEFPEAGLDFDDLSPEGREIIKRAITKLEAGGAFDQLARASRCPNAVRSRPSLEEGALLMMLLPELAPLRRLTRARVASMEMAIAEGAHADAVEGFDQVLVIAQACTHQATLIEQLVGWSVASLALERLRYALDEHPMDAPTLRRYLERLRARTPLGSPALGLEGEWLGFMDVVQRTHSDNGRGSGRAIPTTMPQFLGVTGSGPAPQGSPRIANLLGFVLPSRKALTGKADAFYGEMIRRSRLSYGERHAEGVNPEDSVEELGRRYLMLQMLVPALGKFLDRADIMQCMIEGTKLQLAVEGYRAEHGECPPTLQALVPAWLDAVPEDPYSDGPFVYRLVSGDEQGRGYVLYSVGADGRDDGGLPHPVEPMAAFTRGGEGQDFVFNQPRPPAE